MKNFVWPSRPLGPITCRLPNYDPPSKNNVQWVLNALMAIRGREGQTKFFTAWKVLKVCSKKYIKNYLFFWTSYPVINHPQTLPWFCQLMAIFCNFFTIFLISPTIPVKLKESLIVILFVVVLYLYTVFSHEFAFRKLNNSRGNCVYLGMIIMLSSWWWPFLYVQRVHASTLIW